MTREEAIAIIRKEYLCVDRDCDIERSCGKCDLMMPSKEPILQAYKMAIQALEQEPCEDAVSRQAVLDIDFNRIIHTTAKPVEMIKQEIEQLSPVKSQIGYWRHYENMLICSKCGTEYYDDIMEYCGDDVPKHCPECGARLVEP